MKLYLCAIILALGLILSPPIHPGSASRSPGNPSSPAAINHLSSLEITATPGPGFSPTSTPVAPTATSKKPPTRTPKPTATPLTIPPPSDPSRINLMIGFGVLSVIVVILGIWLNRDRTL